MPWISLVLSLTLAAPQVVVETTDRGPVRGQIQALNDNQVTIDTETGRLHLALADVDTIAPLRLVGDVETAPDPNQWSQLELTTGSVILARQIEVRGGTLHGQFGSASTQGPVAVVRRMRFAPRMAQEDEQWQALTKVDLNLDALIVRKGAALDYVEGVIGDVSSDTVQFTTDGETLEVKLSKLAGLVFHRPQPTVRLPLATIHLRDGSRYLVGSLNSDGRQLSLTIAEEGFATKLDWDQIERIALTAGASVYLNDLAPLEQRWQGYFGGAQQPYLADYYRPRPNVTFSGAPLVLDGREFNKGLAIHSRTTLVYDLDRRFSRLRALAGIDPRAGAQGHVRLVLSGDGRALMDQPIAANQPAQSLDVDVAGVKRLTVLVDFGDNLDLGDHLILGQPRLTP